MAKRWGQRWIACWLGLGLLASVEPAQSDEDVVLKVGSQTLTRAALTARLARFPGPGFSALGATDRERVQAYLEQFVIPELLLVEAANQRKLLDDPAFRPQREQALAAQLEKAIASNLEPKISEAEVEAYFTEQRARFDVPGALLLWRILLDEPERAQEVVNQAQGAQGVTRWRELSREHSLDEATKLRGGSLGFVRADGSTDVPQLRVDPALYLAASKVEDGVVVPQPVEEGGRLAVVWRRGSRAAKHASLAELAPSIRATLLRERTRTALLTLIATLRQQHLTAFHPEHIELGRYPLPSFTPDDAFPAPAGEGKLRPPQQGERGLR